MASPPSVSVVPLPGTPAIVIVPPSSLTRSSMPLKPRPLRRRARQVQANAQVQQEQDLPGVRSSGLIRSMSPEEKKALFAEAPAPLLAKVEKTCRQLNDVIEAGSEAYKSRATAAMTAYGRSLDLLRQSLIGTDRPSR